MINQLIEFCAYKTQWGHWQLIAGARHNDDLNAKLLHLDFGRWNSKPSEQQVINAVNVAEVTLKKEYPYHIRGRMTLHRRVIDENNTAEN